MSDTSSDLIPQIDLVRTNPIAMQRLMLRRLESVTQGEVRIVDPSNPFVHLMDTSCVLAATGMQRNDTLNRRQYPSVAITDEELYLHMSDKDYLNRFATPSRATFSFLLQMDEIKQRAVEVVGTGYKKLTIPRHTEIVVADAAFTFQYPIEIRVMPHGGLIVAYDVEKPSPMYARESNQVEWFITSVNNVEYLRINALVTQIKLTTYTAQMNTITGFSRSYSFDDNFYYCRAFIKSGTNQWREIKTTHTDQVFDPQTPTVALKVLNNRLSVHIPQNYFNDGLMRDSLRIDIYTTKGDIALSLANYLPDAFKGNWIDLDNDNNGRFFAPMRTFSGLAIFSTETTRGGAGALSFDELRERVINRSLSSATVPITNAQMETALEDLGFDLVVNVDNITNRQFLATRAIPKPENGVTASGLGCTIRTFQATMSTLAALDTVSDNGSRITILPTTVFRNDNGVLSIANNGQIQDLKNPLVTPLDVAINTINADDLMYTPFHYVLDINDNEFQARPYQLDRPEITAKRFMFENELLNIDAPTIAYEIAYVGEGVNQGYIMFVEIKASDSVKALDVSQLRLQLSYIPPGSTGRVVFEGALAVATFVDSDTLNKPLEYRYIYRFNLNSAFDIDAANRIYFTASSTPALLTTTFDLAIVVLDHTPSGAGPSQIDDLIDVGAYIPPASSALGVIHEKFTIKFGDYLKNLWIRGRSFVDSVEFERYTDDVLATYGSTVFQRDLGGNIELVYNATTEEYEYNVLHWAGEPVLNTTGEAARDAFLLANPTWPTDYTIKTPVPGGKAISAVQLPNTVWDWIMSLTNQERIDYIDNIDDIRFAPNSIDVPVLNATGEAQYDAWVIANPTITTTLFHWWLNNGPSADPDRNPTAPAALTVQNRKDYSVIKFEAGDVILDEYGDPAITNGGARGILRQFEMLLIDGKYYFATEPVTTEYRDQTVDRIVDWVMVDIAGLSKQVLEQTQIYFYPKSNTGLIRVIAGDSERATIRADQRIQIILQVYPDVYNNATLRDSLTQTAITTVADAINTQRVSHSACVSKLANAMGDNVVSIELLGLFEDRFKVVSMVDNAMRPAIGKQMVVLSNNQLAIRDAVDVLFVRHV